MSLITYEKALSPTQASTLYRQAEEPRYLAGGMTLLPTMRQRLVMPDRLIDLAGCDLGMIGIDGAMIVIGAMATHAEVSNSEIVRRHLPALASLAGGIGDRQVRVRGTIGGSLANNDPAACYPAAALALGAVIVTDQREITAEAYFVDLFETALAEGELIIAVKFPLVQKAAYVKAPNPASRYAMVGIFVAECDQEIKVAVTGAGESGVFRLTAAETLLSQSFTSQALADFRVPEEGLMSDIHASAAFRAYMIKTMTQKAVAMAAQPSL